MSGLLATNRFRRWQFPLVWQFGWRVSRRSKMLSRTRYISWFRSEPLSSSTEWTCQLLRGPLREFNQLHSSVLTRPACCWRLSSLSVRRRCLPHNNMSAREEMRNASSTMCVLRGYATMSEISGLHVIRCIRGKEHSLVLQLFPSYWVNCDAGNIRNVGNSRKFTTDWSFHDCLGDAQQKRQWKKIFQRQTISSLRRLSLFTFVWKEHLPRGS